MRAFAFESASEAAGAIHAHTSTASYLAGGTTLLDLMKLDVMRPAQVIDINALSAAHADIRVEERGLTLGALARMSAVADHAGVKRDYPVIAHALAQAASAQIRNMASLGGNVLQRTRCTYFRDVSYAACNKREPGSGCAAMDGVNRRHAVLGVSDACIATYPGDFAEALIALDATVDIAGHGGARTLPFAQLHVPPRDAPQIETTLAPGELIVAFHVPAGPWTRRSLYRKIRDRASYDFALASAAVALDLDGATVREARIALGGVATVPWRAREAETDLNGKRLDAVAARHAADVAFTGAKPRPGNAYKVELGKRTLTRALLEAAALEV